MISIIEMQLNRLIEDRFPNDTWCEVISPGRLEKARSLLEERRRRSQDLGLLDCLQLSDKGQLVSRDKQLRDHIGFASRRIGEQRTKEIEVASKRTGSFPRHHGRRLGHNRPSIVGLESHPHVLANAGKRSPMKRGSVVPTDELLLTWFGGPHRDLHVVRWSPPTSA